MTDAGATNGKQVNIAGVHRHDYVPQGSLRAQRELVCIPVQGVDVVPVVVYGSRQLRQPPELDTHHRHETEIQGMGVLMKGTPPDRRLLRSGILNRQPASRWPAGSSPCMRWAIWYTKKYLHVVGDVRRDEGAAAPFTLSHLNSGQVNRQAVLLF